MASTKRKYRKPLKDKKVSVKGLAAKVKAVEASTDRSEAHPDFKSGDTIKVHVRIKEGDKERTQAYEGVVIARDGGGGNKSFNVRKISHGVGVERIFMDNSPKIAKIEILERGQVRRAKLYYLRELEGRAAKIEREIETSESAAQSAAAKSSTK